MDQGSPHLAENLKQCRRRIRELEQMTPAVKERYDQEVQAMLERRITGIGRWVRLGSTVMSMVFAVLLGVLAMIPPLAEVPRLARIPVAVGALFSVGFAILLLRVFRRRSIDLKSDTSFFIGMLWVFVVLIVAMFMDMSLLAADRIVGLWMSVFGLVVLVIGAVFLIRHGIAQSELRTREKLLEIEYRLAELAEMAKPGKRKPSKTQFNGCSSEKRSPVHLSASPRETTAPVFYLMSIL